MSADAGEYKSRVLDATDIVKLIGQSVALKRRGKDLVGLCPFHSEKTPSFYVSPSKRMFFCYGCKAGGDAISFVMKRDRIEFLEALHILGDEAGIERPVSRGGAPRSGERQLLLEIQSRACSFFEKLLQHPQQGNAARAYLQQRHINSESIRRFQIGVAPAGWDGLLSSELARKFTPQQIALAGLTKPRQQGEGFYDTFRNRLMFPIRDEAARIVGFGARVMPDSQDTPKYLNSPETPLFSKGRSIFGIDLARQKMVETRTAVVVEGYTDVVVAHQFGVGNVVSVLGTAMTAQQVATLRRFVDRIVLLFDADSAGDIAVDRAVGLFLTQPVEIAIASMPAGIDPDEYLIQNGAEAFAALVQGAIDALSYKWKQLSQRFVASQENLTGQQAALEAYLQVVSQARQSGPVDAIRWGSALARVSRLSGIPVEQLNRRFSARAARQKPRESGGSDAAQTPRWDVPTAQVLAERRILGALLLEPSRWATVQQEIELGDFSDPRHRRLAEIYWTMQRDHGEPVFNEFLGMLQDNELLDLAVAAVDEVEALADPKMLIDESLAHMARVKDLSETRKLLAEVRRTTENSAPQREIELLQKIQERCRRPNPYRVG